MSPLEAVNEVCRHFCSKEKSADVLDENHPTFVAQGHDDACVALHLVLREWAALRLVGTGE